MKIYVHSTMSNYLCYLLFTSYFVLAGCNLTVKVKRHILVQSQPLLCFSIDAYLGRCHLSERKKNMQSQDTKFGCHGDRTERKTATPTSFSNCVSFFSFPFLCVTFECVNKGRIQYTRTMHYDTQPSTEVG